MFVNPGENHRPHPRNSVRGQIRMPGGH